MTERGLYQQPESDAAAIVADEEAYADSKADRTYQTYVKQMATAVDAEIQASLTASRAAAAGKLGVVRSATASEVESLKAQAKIVDKMKAVGFAPMVAESTLNVGRFHRHEMRGIVGGATGSDKPTAKAIKVKSDGRRDRRIDRQRRIMGRELDIMKMTPAEVDAAVAADKLDKRVYDLIAELNGGTQGLQEASRKDDAADTGEWFG